MSERERIIDEAAKLLRDAFPDVAADRELLARAADALGHGKEGPRFSCGECGRDVSHLVLDGRYGGCLWCGSFALRTEAGA